MASGVMALESMRGVLQGVGVGFSTLKNRIQIRRPGGGVTSTLLNLCTRYTTRLWSVRTMHVCKVGVGPTDGFTPAAPTPFD
jgi:hypothetical protein